MVDFIAKPVIHGPYYAHRRAIEEYESLLRQYIVRYGGGAVWPLDDAVGATSIRELSGLYPGTKSASGVTLGATGPVICGQDARAAAFDGAAGYITSSYAPLTMAGAWTVALWINATANSSTYRCAFGCARTDETNTLFMLASTGVSPYKKAIVFLRTSSGAALLNAVASTGNVYDGVWHHLAFTNNNGTAALYIDGAKDGTNYNYTPSGTYAPTISTIGALVRTSTTYYLPGSLAYATVIPAALSAAEILGLYNAGRYGL